MWPTVLHLLVCIFCALHRYNKPNKLDNHKYRIYYVSLIKLVPRFYSWSFDLLNYKIFINEFQIVKEFQYSVASSFIDSGAGFVLSIWFI